MRLVAVLIISLVQLSGCMSQAALRNGAGPLLQFSDDELVRLDIDINNVLYDEICRTYIDHGKSPAIWKSGAPTACHIVAPSAGALPKGNREGARVFSQLIAQLDRGDGVDQRRIRDSLVSQMLGASELGCQSYLAQLRGSQADSRFTSDFLAVLFAGASSVTDAVKPSSLYAELSGLSIATGASLDRTYFANQAMELVAKQIDNARPRERAAIVRKLESRNYAQYPAGVAVADALRYHAHCNIMYGLADMNEALAKRETAVRATQEAAARVAAEGGTGRQVSAAVAGVEYAMLGVGESRTDEDIDDLFNMSADLTKDVDMVAAAFKQVVDPSKIEKKGTAADNGSNTLVGAKDKLNLLHDGWTSTDCISFTDKAGKGVTGDRVTEDIIAVCRLLEAAESVDPNGDDYSGRLRAGIDAMVTKLKAERLLERAPAYQLIRISANDSSSSIGTREEFKALFNQIVQFDGARKYVFKDLADRAFDDGIAIEKSQATATRLLAYINGYFHTLTEPDLKKPD